MTDDEREESLKQLEQWLIDQKRFANFLGGPVYQRALLRGIMRELRRLSDYPKSETDLVEEGIEEMQRQYGVDTAPRAQLSLAWSRPEGALRSRKARTRKIVLRLVYSVD